MMTLSRRRFLASTAAGLGLSTLRAPRPAAAAQTVRFSGWAFEPQVVEANAKRFMEQYPDIKVEYTPLDLQLYNEKMVALFNAGTQPDCYYVRDINLGAWVEAGWMQPIDGLPGLAELDRDIFPFNLEALKYKGKQYGTPYYGDIYVCLHVRQESRTEGRGRQAADHPRRAEAGRPRREEE
jgi:ABC-type glycerol-3-phosphate transport system substrate-binding protein